MKISVLILSTMLREETRGDGLPRKKSILPLGQWQSPLARRRLMPASILLWDQSGMIRDRCLRQTGPLGRNADPLGRGLFVSHWPATVRVRYIVPGQAEDEPREVLYSHH
jgi:hypothetical protein